MQGMITSAASSTSSLYGNVGCTMRELILSHFPANFFTYVNVSSELPFRNMKRVFGTNTSKEINKRKKPYLIIRPSYVIPDEDSFLQEVPLTKNLNNIQYNRTQGYLFGILADKENGYDLSFKLNHDKIDYDVTITLNSLHEQLDLYKAMVNQMMWKKTFSYTAALESIIPKSLIMYIAQMCRIDLSTHSELIPVFIQRMNALSRYPITYKIRNSSAIEEFFMYYSQQLLITMYDLDLEEGSKKNMIDDDFKITFKVSVEFNLPGLYTLCGSEAARKCIDVTLSYPEFNNGESNSMEYIPIYTMSNLFNRYPVQLDGMTLYASLIFRLEPDKDKSDTIEISSLFDNDYLAVIRQYVQLNIPTVTITKIIILRDTVELVENRDYIMDWNNMRIILHNVDSYATYRAVLYTNNTLINDTISEYIETSGIDKSKLKENYAHHTIPIPPPPDPTPDIPPEVPLPDPGDADINPDALTLWSDILSMDKDTISANTDSIILER